MPINDVKNISPKTAEVTMEPLDIYGGRRINLVVYMPKYLAASHLPSLSLFFSQLVKGLEDEKDVKVYLTLRYPDSIGDPEEINMDELNAEDLPGIFDRFIKKAVPEGIEL